MANATVRRVNNTPNINVPYANLTAAYNAAVDGDTIYIEGTTIDYGNLSVYKRLVFIGSGYFLNQNPETQANQNPSTVTSIYFYAGSSGSKVLGLTINTYLYFAVSGQDYVIRRNSINSLYNIATVSNSYFEQNMINVSNGFFLNTLFRNNFMSTGSISSNNNSLFLTNNVIYSMTFTMVELRNNIIYSSLVVSGCNFYNNVCSSTQAPAGNGNLLNVAMTDVFVCWASCTAYSSDARYQLKAGSPAIGAGTNGEDCGMFGGTDPYVLSGMPPIPAIYNFNYNFNNSTITVDMKVKSHN